jgi:hypothetical protein
MINEMKSWNNAMEIVPFIAIKNRPMIINPIPESFSTT